MKRHLVKAIPGECLERNGLANDFILQGLRLQGILQWGYSSGKLINKKIASISAIFWQLLKKMLMLLPSNLMAANKIDLFSYIDCLTALLPCQSIQAVQLRSIIVFPGGGMLVGCKRKLIGDE